MKTVLKVLAGLSLVLVIGIGLLLWNLNPLIDSLRPIITTELSKAVGHKVEIGGISLSLFPTTGIELEKLKLESNTDDTFVDSLILETSLGELLSRKIRVNKFSVNNASLRLTKKKDGSLFLGPMRITAKGSAEKTGNAKKETATQAKTKEQAHAAIAIALSAAKISNLNIIVIDQSISPVQEIRLENLEVELEDISETSMGTLELSGDLLGTSRGNLRLKGQLGLKKTPLGIPYANLQLALMDIDLERITQLASAYGVNAESLSLSNQASFEAQLVSNEEGIKLSPIVDLEAAGLKLPGLIKDSGAPMNLRAELKPDFGSSLELPPNTIPSIAGSFLFEAAKFELSENKEAPLTVSSLKLPVKLQGKIISVEPFELQLNGSPISIGTTITLADLKTPPIATIKPLNISAFKGSLDGSSIINLRDKNISLKLSGGGFDLESVSKAVMAGSPTSISGKVEVLSISATSPLSAPKPSATGSLSTKLINGTITGINIIRETLNGLDNIPGLEGSLTKRIPERYKPLLTKNGTQFDTLSLQTNIAGETVRIETLELAHELFTLSGTGNYRLDGSFLLNAQFRLPLEASSEMVEKQKNLKSLLDKNGQLVIPLSIKKNKDSSPVVLPDVRELGELAIKNQAKEKAKKSLDKYVPGAGGLIDSLF